MGLRLFIGLLALMLPVTAHSAAPSQTMVLGACNTAYNGELRPQAARSEAIASCEQAKKEYVARGGVLPRCRAVNARTDIGPRAKKAYRAGCVAD